MAKLDTKIERALDLAIELGDLPEAKARLKELERLSPAARATAGAAIRWVTGNLRPLGLTAPSSSDIQTLIAVRR